MEESAAAQKNLLSVRGGNGFFVVCSAEPGSQRHQQPCGELAHALPGKLRACRDSHRPRLRRSGPNCTKAEENPSQPASIHTPSPTSSSVVLKPL